MEFILFLSQIDKEILELIYKSNNSIEENTELCLLDRKYVGFYKRKEKKVIICTENAKVLGRYKDSRENHKTKIYIRRGLRHEATHLAQSCNKNKPLKLIKNIEKKLHKSKIKALNSSIKVSGNYRKELEAYYMEDKPRKVKQIIKSYCL